MLSYKTGISGSALYYYRPTQSPEEMARARYYTQSDAPPTPMDRLAADVVNGHIDLHYAVDSMLSKEFTAQRAANDPPVWVAQLVHVGQFSFSDGARILFKEYPAHTFDPDAARKWAEDRLVQEMERIDVAAHRIEADLQVAIAQIETFGAYKHTIPEVRKSISPEMAALLGIDLQRPPTIPQMANLMRAHRADGAPIQGKEYATERTYTDKRSGREKTSHPLAYVDFCLAPDKSVSYAQAMAEPAEAALLWRAHVQAADEVMAYIEKSVAQVRRGKEGTRVECGEIPIFAFDHFTARPTSDDGKPGPANVPGDMHMHRHHIVPNVVLASDGYVGSLDLKHTMGKIKEWGLLYQGSLARNLMALGVEVVQEEKIGAARIRKIPENTIRHFDRRTRLAEALAKQHDPIGWHNLPEDEKVRRRKAAAQDNRLPKRDANEGSKERWRAEAEALGHRYHSVVDPQRPIHRPSRERMMDIAYRQTEKNLEVAFENSSVLGAQDVRVAAAKALVFAGGADSPGDIDELVRSMAKRGIVQAGQRTAIIWGSDTDPITGQTSVRVTTVLHEKQERAFVALAKRAGNDMCGSLSKRQIAGALRWATTQGIDYSGEHGEKQKAAFEQIAKGGKLSVMIGAAGSGKSRGVLRPLIHAYHRQGREVWGTALAWRQTQDFADAGVPHNRRLPISEFIKYAKSGSIKLGRSSVLAIDEVATVSASPMLDILKLQRQHGFSIVGFGDPEQSRAVEHGNVVGLFKRALGNRMPEIETTIRQVDPRQREIADHLRNGRGNRAVDMLRADGDIVVATGGPEAVAQRIAALWKERTDVNKGRDGYTLTLSVPSNRDALDVGRAIRALRRNSGEVAQPELTLHAQGQKHGPGDGYELQVSVGDRVRLFNRISTAKGQAPLAVNGDLVTISALDRAGMHVRNAEGISGHIEWKRIQDRETGRVRLTYGYAQVINPLQGVSSTEHINAAPRGTQSLNGYSGYTAGSRHTHRTWLVTSDAAERQQLSRSLPLGTPPPNREDVYEQMGKNLSRKLPKESALDLLERARNVRRGTVDGFMLGMQRRACDAVWEIQESRQDVISVAKSAIVDTKERLAWIVATVRQKAAPRPSLPPM